MTLEQGIEYTASDIFLDFPPSSIAKLSFLSSDPTEELRLVSVARACTSDKNMALLSLRSIAAHCDILKIPKNFGVLRISTLLKATLTIEQLVELMKKANDSLLNTEEGISHVIGLINPSPKKKSIEPGTLRFFSSELICYWTGKNWIKIGR